MDDDIQLPPLPPRPPVVDGDAAMLAYGRACYKAGLVIGKRRAEQAQPAQPKVHSARVVLTSSGYVWMECGGKPLRPACTVTLCWTDDGRVWIDSERNRGLAKMLRDTADLGYTSPTDEALRDAASALDGGER